MLVHSRAKIGGRMVGISCGVHTIFGDLHVLRAEPTYATAVTETDGVAYTLESSVLNAVSHC